MWLKTEVVMGVVSGSVRFAGCGSGRGISGPRITGSELAVEAFAAADIARARKSWPD